jgi:hypothetical protein
MWCSCEKVGNDEKIPTTQCARYLHPVAQNAENGVTDPRNKKKTFPNCRGPRIATWRSNEERNKKHPRIHPWADGCILMYARPKCVQVNGGHRFILNVLFCIKSLFIKTRILCRVCRTYNTMRHSYNWSRLWSRGVVRQSKMPIFFVSVSGPKTRHNNNRGIKPTPSAKMSWGELVPIPSSAAESRAILQKNVA